MPVNQGSSGGLAAKLGQRLEKAVDAHKNDETVVGGGGELPALEGGIAQLVDCRFGQYKQGDMKGQYFFMAAGIVLEPEAVDVTDSKGNVRSIKVKGKRTQIGPEPICDTPKRESRPTLDDHVAWVINQMALLGYPREQLSGATLETAAATLIQAKPVFEFRTWKGKATKEYPNPNTFHEWAGAVEYTAPAGGETAGVDESTGGNVSTESNEAPPDDAQTVDWSASTDLMALAEAGDAGDQDASARLIDLATAAGYTNPQIVNTTSWVALATDMSKPKTTTAPAKSAPAKKVAAKKAEHEYITLARKADNDGDGDAATALQEVADAAGVDTATYTTWTAFAEAAIAGFASADNAAGDAPWEGPKVEDVHLFKPRTKGPGGKEVIAKKPVECEVTAVDPAAQTCDFLNMTDKKTVYKAVPWDQIEQG